MVQLSSLLEVLARSVSFKKPVLWKDDMARETAEALAEEAKKNHLMSRSCGMLNTRSNNITSVFSKKGEKGTNQDCLTVWKEFGCQEDIMFCGVFDGHGPWGHFVAKRVSKSLPPSLLCHWQERIALDSAGFDFELDTLNNMIFGSNHTRRLVKRLIRNSNNRVNSGTTALTILRQGEQIVVANVGDSRAVLATIGGWKLVTSSAYHRSEAQLARVGREDSSIKRASNLFK